MYFLPETPEIKAAAVSVSELRNYSGDLVLARAGVVAGSRLSADRTESCALFSKSQLNEIVDGVIANDQIYSIAQDTDINSYLLQLIQGRDADIPALKLAQFHETVSSQSAAQVEREAS